MKDTRKKLEIVKLYPNDYNHFSEVNLDDYRILYDEDCHEAAFDAAKEMVCYCSPAFLAGFFCCPIEVVDAIQKTSFFEGNNEIFLKWADEFADSSDLICSMIDEDGYGVYLASYDHLEHEVVWNDESYYFFRIN